MQKSEEIKDFKKNNKKGKGCKECIKFIECKTFKNH